MTPPPTNSILVIVSDEVSAKVQDELMSADKSITISKKQHYNGAADELVIIGASLTALRIVLKFALDMAKLKRVKVIETGTTKIENPTDDQVAQLLKTLEGKSSKQDSPESQQ